MSKTYDHVGAIIAYEAGELDEEGALELFQHLVDTGLAWQLQGSYGRTARALIESSIELYDREGKNLEVFAKSILEILGK